jgi:excinuclease ABC subunit C
MREFPQKPGVYLFKDKSGKIIYIGKAKNLRKRINSYFAHGDNQSRKLSRIIRNAEEIEHIITANETEALILEGNLIKKHRPRYNVDLKDDANYPFFKLDITTQYPRVSVVRRMKNDGALYFGPYPSVTQARSALHLIGPVFPLRKCTTKDIPKRSRPCLNYQLGRCLAPCCKEVSREEYLEIVDQVRLFLEGRNKELISKLNRVMQKASRELDFEKAARVRDQIRAVEKTVEKQTVVSSKRKDQDIVGVSRLGREAEVVMLVVRGGSMVGSRSYSIRGEWEDSSEIVESFIKQYYRDKQFVPREIILSHPIEDRAVISEWLTGMAGKKVSITVPSRGDKRRLAEMAEENADTILVRKHKVDRFAILEEIRGVLRLKRKPLHIEAIDVSNLRGDLAVACIVSFFEGVPQKSGYRNYRISGVQGINDYAMIAEGIARRLRRGKSPDLFVIDGGKGHLAVAIKTLDDLKLDNPPDAISIAKADRARPRDADRIYLPHRKNPVDLAKNHPVLSFFMHVRDETHRRAVSYYRKRRKKKLTTSELDMISGIGPQRKKALLRFFGDIQTIAGAEIADLVQVTGIADSIAKSVFDHFHKKPPEEAGP